MTISFQGAHFPSDIILMGVRWYLAYPLRYRHVEELREERGVPVDHATIQRWVVKYSPFLAEAFQRCKRSIGVSWRMDETFYGAAVVKPFFSRCAGFICFSGHDPCPPSPYSIRPGTQV